ncbi:MAG: efflux RND transporter periplasmic adaptor subunit, partial [Polyangia bacterium]
HGAPMRPCALVWMASMSIVMASCTKAQHHQQWTCPMHPQYLSDKAGDCPICGMRLVPVEKPAVAPAAPARKIVAYRSPMDPRQTSSIPKKDEMGMDYVPVYAPGDERGPDAGGAPVLSIDAARQRMMELRTVVVARGTLAGAVRTTGRVAVDEARVYKVTARFDGYIEKLQADFTGKLVRKGDALASIYSPELLATEEEYLLARRSEAELTRSGLPDVAKSARARLRLYGIGEGEIARLEKRGTAERALTITAPISGYVTAKTAVAGAKVSPDTALFEIVDLSRVWILADVYEQELPRVRLGQPAIVTSTYWPSRSWKGPVSYIYPTVDDKTRTVKVRVEVANQVTELKPEMFVDVSIATEPRSALLVPDDAVIDSGTRKVAFVVVGEGKLQARELEVGLHANRQYEVLRGLKEGDRVAAGASFLLDSESSLKAALSAMAPPIDGGVK